MLGHAQNSKRQYQYSFDHKMPESLRAFCRIVSFTAAKTSRMFVVSVACVRLVGVSGLIFLLRVHLLRIEVELSAVDLVEPPQ